MLLFFTHDTISTFNSSKHCVLNDAYVYIAVLVCTRVPLCLQKILQRYIRCSSPSILHYLHSHVILSLLLVQNSKVFVN